MFRNFTPKKLLSIILFCGLSTLLFAQEPPSDINGEELKLWLKTNWYNGKHTELGYSTARLKMYQTIDNTDNTITCVYSGYEKSWSSSNTSTNPQPINCEHTVPQSFFGSAEPMKSDIHHLFPTYGNWNSVRSNHPFAEINDDQTTNWMYLATSSSTIPTSDIDFYSEYASSQFEPREDHKGNCARAVFYFYTMYASTVGDISTVGNLETLYQWHLADPVDAEEIKRNDDIETFQGNRNPYIDYPELVERAFVNFSSGPLAPSASIQANESEITLSWTNVANETGYKIYRSTDNVNYSIVETPLADVLQYVDQSVVEGTNYYYYVIAFNDDGNSAASNIVSATLVSAGGGGSNELFFSEYVEGSSYDKAVEIANYTGDAVNLSAYSIMKQTNGAGEWKDELTLSGSLANGSVYVVCHNDASATIKAVADYVVPSSYWTISFNGNDPVGLFKNGSLIDVIGTFNSTAKFGENVTLIRKASVTGPNTTFSMSEWDSKSSGTISNLGLHTINSPTDIDDELTSLDFGLKVYPIPAENQITIELVEAERLNEYTVSIVELSGKVVYSKAHNAMNDGSKTEVNVSAYSKGIYFVTVQTGAFVTNKKIVIQ
ncbi:endonuclease [Carboxylicivirga sp. RSCT41]|uniref:endonuclease n=1 Tax=Carboxylicivirga agarovorans TaxID=3417570 RepID=UPI003D3585DE